MKRELILHIGTTKTGSTSVQKVLSRSREALLRQGVCYPLAPGRVQHNLLAHAAMDPEVRARRFRSRQRESDAEWPELLDADTLLAELGREMDALGDSVTRTIISSEYIYIYLHRRTEVQRLRDMLHPWFDPVKVIVYLRRQDAHLTSLYTQLLRAGVVRSPDEFKFRERPLHELDYSGLLQRWADVFGRENIEPRLFERGPDRRFDVVEDFCRRCGIAISEIADSLRDSNPSVEHAGQVLLADLGKLIQKRTSKMKVGSSLWRCLTSAVTEACQGSGWKPRREAAQRFYEQYREGNEAVRRIWFPARISLFNEDFSEYPEEEMQTTMDERYAAACRTILALAESNSRRRRRSARVSVNEAHSEVSPGLSSPALEYE